MPQGRRWELDPTGTARLNIGTINLATTPAAAMFVSIIFW